VLDRFARPFEVCCDERPGLKRTPASSFEEKYRDLGDPVALQDVALRAAALRHRDGHAPALRYRRAFEPGCSVGELTARLAFRADALLAMDCSPTAVETARARCRGLDHVSFTLGELPAAWPAGRFDLVVLSEIGYYFDRADLRRIVSRSADALLPGGTLLALHWRGHSKDHVLHGDDGPRGGPCRGSEARAARRRRYCEDAFRADVWTRGER
jgi:SAM-dependent methyltransferase